MNRTQLNLALLVLAAALGAGVFFSQKKEEKGPPLTPLTAETLNKIAIEHPGNAAIVLVKTGGDWNLTAPVAARVDEFEINALLGLADREAKETLNRAQVKLAELGLDPPQYIITLNDTAIAFGGVEPLQYRRYVKVGEAVFLIEDPPSAALDKDYADLVAKGLFGDKAEIERIVLPQLTLSKGQEGKWVIKPADPNASADSMQRLADGWKAARSMWNEMPKDLKPKGDNVVVTLKDGTEHRFVILDRDQQFKLYSPTAGVNYVLSKALTEELLKLPEVKKEEEKPEAEKQ